MLFPSTLTRQTSRHREVSQIASSPRHRAIFATAPPPAVNRIATHLNPERPPVPGTPDGKRDDWAETLFEAMRFLRDRLGHRDPEAVVSALAVADDGLAAVEIEVLDSQGERLEQSQAGAVLEPGDQAVGAVEGREDAADFVAGEDDGQPRGAVDAHEGAEVAGFDFQDGAVEEDQGAEGLRLGRGGDVAFGGEVGEEGVDLAAAHFGGVAFVVEEDVAAAPVAVAVFGAVGELPDAAGRAEAVEQFGLPGEGRFWRRGDHGRDGKRAGGECQRKNGAAILDDSPRTVVRGLRPKICDYSASTPIHRVTSVRACGETSVGGTSATSANQS